MEQLNPRKLDMLSGPIAFYFYKDVDTRRILLLSDIHFHGTKCNKNKYNVIDYVLDLSIIQDIDFFIEQSFIVEPITKMTKYASTSILSQIINHFEPYYINTKYAYINNLRYHYIDVRSFKLGEKGTLYLFSQISPLNKKLLSNTGYKFNAKYHVNNLKNIILSMMGLSDLNNFTSFYEDINVFALNESIYVRNNPSKIYSASSHIIYQDIVKYFDIYLPLIQKRQSKLEYNLNEFNVVFVDLIIKRCEMILLGLDIESLTSIRTYALLQEICNITIHYYSLLRIFGYYNDGSYNKNIIMYCGHNHNKFYNQFIFQYFNIIPDVTIINEINIGLMQADQCIKFNEYFDYFM